MRVRSVWLGALVVAAVASAFAIYACSSKSSSYPTGPGGGGGGVELNSGNIPNGSSFSHTFTTAGSFSYHCSIHAGMTGTVVVNSGGSTMDTSMAMVTFNGYPTVTLKTGGTVHWNNSSGTTHTVTSN
jgi:plastocyanin